MSAFIIAVFIAGCTHIGMEIQRPWMSFKNPLQADHYITSHFGPRIRKDVADFHKGIDFAIKQNSEVFSSASGTVCEAGFDPNGYGFFVVVCHGNKVRTLYGHLSRVYVSKDQKITVSERIGLTGTTGRSTGPHLHFELIIDGRPVNPVEYIMF